MTIAVELKIIKTKKQYQSALKWVDNMFDRKVSPISPEGEKLQVVLLLIRHYEDEHFQIPQPDPIDVIKLRMEELGLRNKDLVGKIGSKGYVSSLLSKRKPLTLEIARVFHRELNIPAEVLIS